MIICENCGTKREGARLACPGCGQTVPNPNAERTAQPAPALADTSPDPTAIINSQHKKKPRKLTPRLIALLVLLLCAVGYLTYNMIWSEDWRAGVSALFDRMETLSLPGKGTQDAPYRIGSAEDLARLADMVSKGKDYTGCYFELTQDIDLTKYLEKSQTGWTPIGSKDAPFSGVFNGAGHEITGLWIDCESQIGIGLFGYALFADICDLHVQTAGNGIVIRGEESGFISILVGRMDGGSIVDCLVSGKINISAPDDPTSKKLTAVGGLIGLQIKESSIIHCSAQIDIIVAAPGSNTVGGLIGTSTGGRILDCWTDAIIELHDGEFDAGGLVGFLVESTVCNSYASGRLTLEGSKINAGGLISAAMSGDIDCCYATVDILARGNDVMVGGLISGYIFGTIGNCFATGSVTAYGPQIGAGGLVGIADKARDGEEIIKNCYAIGQVKADGEFAEAGGLFGMASGDVVSGCYYNTESTGQLYFAGKGSWLLVDNWPEGKKTAEMLKKETYSGWDFDTIWYMPESGYPRLRGADSLPITLD